MGGHCRNEVIRPEPGGGPGSGGQKCIKRASEYTWMELRGRLAVRLLKVGRIMAELGTSAQVLQR